MDSHDAYEAWPIHKSSRACHLRHWDFGLVREQDFFGTLCPCFLF